MTFNGRSSIIFLVTDNVIINKKGDKINMVLKSDKTVFINECLLHENNVKGWTPWQPLIGFDGQTDAMYRTNRKKVQVKFLTTKDRAECCCCKNDEFNIGFGIQLAYLRCLNKARKRQRIELEEKLNSIEHEIAENNTIIKKMVNSLEI